MSTDRGKASASPAPTEPAAFLDLTGVTCPLNWVKTRLALEGLGRGETLAVRLDRGEPLESVPRSAGEEGHQVEVIGTVVRIVKR